MSASAPPRITFDTNVCNVVHEPTKWPRLVAPDDARKIRTAITEGRIAGFVSEGSLFVECLSFPDKLAYLAVAGTPRARPVPDRRAVARFNDLGKIGMKLLHAPLIEAEIFIHPLEWAKDEVFSTADRHVRFGSFVKPLGGKQKLQECGQALEAKHPQLFGESKVRGPISWLRAFKRAWDSGDAAGRKALRRKVGPVIGEWCDGLILGSHVGYGNDVFCTTDEGGNAGSRSLLHPSNRANLSAQGITLMSPAELVKKYSAVDI
jgi:hypothetical protein